MIYEITNIHVCMLLITIWDINTHMLIVCGKNTSYFCQSLNSNFLSSILSLVNSLLLFPLILHHKIHTHFLNGNWSEIVNTVRLFAEYLKHNIKALFQHFTRSRKRNTRTNQSHVTDSASQVTSSQSHVTSLGHKSD